MPSASQGTLGTPRTVQRTLQRSSSSKFIRFRHKRGYASTAWGLAAQCFAGLSIRVPDGVFVWLPDSRDIHIQGAEKYPAVEPQGPEYELVVAQAFEAKPGVL